MGRVPMKKYLVDDTDYYVYSRGRGPILLFAHGFPFDSRLFVPVVDLLESRFHCVVPDLRGFGMTKLGANGHNPEGHPRVKMGRFADDLAILTAILACQEHNKDAKIVLCGLSMGGYISLSFARRHPERLDGLIFCDSNTTQDSPEKVQNRLALADTVDATNVAQTVDNMIPTLLCGETLEHRHDIVEQLRTIMRSQTPAAFAAASRGMAKRGDSSDILSQITAPTLVLGGEYDLLSNVACLDAIAAKIPNATRATIPHSGHLPPLENPEAFAKAVVKWYDEKIGSTH